MISIVCGGAGFVGTNLIRRLLPDRKVVCVDDLSLGSVENIEEFSGHKNFLFKKIDLSNKNDTLTFFQQYASEANELEVWHLAANSDILAGIENLAVDLSKTFMTTVQILEGMKAINAKKLFFASSSAVYGDLGEKRIDESHGPLLPISNYGAMKLASEGLISAALESFLSHALLFRFPNVVGTPATHGVILDFVKKLSRNPKELQVLGDGKQKKSYLHVCDLVDAMIHLRSRAAEGVEVYNIGSTDEGVHVHEIAEEVVHCLTPGAHIRYGKANKGWVGDVPRFSYSVDKLLATGWERSLTSIQAVKKAIQEIIKQEKNKSEGCS